MDRTGPPAAGETARAAEGERPAGVPRGPGSASVPWLGARLKASPGGALALGILVAVTAFLAVCVPREVGALDSDALRHALAQVPEERRGVTVTAEVGPASPAEAGRGVVPSPRELRAGAQALRDAARPPLVTDRDNTVFGVRSADTAVVLGDGPAAPYGAAPRLTLLTQPQETEAHARLVSGRMPSPRAGRDTVEAVVTARTAEVMDLAVGSTVGFRNLLDDTVTVRVSGIVVPLDPASPYWNAAPDLLEPGLRTSGQTPPQRYRHFTALIDGGAREILPYCGEGGAVAYWYHPVRTGALAAADVPALRRSLASLTTGPDAVRLQGDLPVDVPELDAGDLLAVLGAFEEERRTARSLVLTAALGVGTVAAVTLVMAGALAAAGRRTELELLRARGGSLPGIGLLLLGETAAVVLPAAATGAVCALLWTPGPWNAASLLPAAAVAVPACLTLPLLAVSAHRRPRPPARGDLAAARPSRRRAVAELTVAALAVAALAAVRHGAAGEDDLLTAGAPVLASAVAALVLLRLYPLPLRLLARRTVRLRGPVLCLALTRAARAPAVSVLPLLAVLVALTVTSFGGSVLAGAAEARARAALAEVGADARVKAATALPGGLEGRIRRTPGVSDTAAVRIERGRSLSGAFSSAFTLVFVEPRSYARLAGRTGLDGGGPFPAGELAGAAPGGPLPAVVSPGVARTLGEEGTGVVDAGHGAVRIRAVAVRDETPATSGEFAVVPAVSDPAADGARPPRPTALLVSGAGIDGDALAAEVRRAGEGLTTVLRSRTEDGYGAGPLQEGVRRVYAAAVAAGAGYGALALLLALLRSAPERGVLLARLRTMGMSRRQGRALVWAEALPLLVLGVVGGLGTAVLVVSSLGPGVDPTPLAFTAGSRPAGGQDPAVVLTPDAASLLWPAAVLSVLVCGIVAAQARPGGGRGEGERLRAGEERG